MASLALPILKVLIELLGFILSSLPLYFSVKFLGGKTTILKTAFVALMTGIIISAIKYQFHLLGGLVAFFVLIWIYHEVFRLKWLKAFLAWVLQFVFIALFYVLIFLLFGALLGISLLALLI